MNHGALYFRDGYSQEKAAVYSRNKRLTDDAFMAKTLESKRRSENRKKTKKLRVEADTKAKILNLRGSLLDRIKFHVNRGRDCGDIAIREGLRVSVVLAALEQIKAKEANV